MLYRISDNGKWYRADGCSRRSPLHRHAFVPVPQAVSTAKALKAVAAGFRPCRPLRQGPLRVGCESLKVRKDSP
jgi:hypothetical protein